MNFARFTGVKNTFFKYSVSQQILVKISNIRKNKTLKFLVQNNLSN